MLAISTPVVQSALSGLFSNNNRVPVVNGANSLAESNLSFLDDVLSTVSGFIGIGAGATQQGSEVLGVDGLSYFAGNVGIGGTRASGQLHVQTASANTILTVGNNSAYDQLIYLRGNYDWSIGMNYSNNNALTFAPSSDLSSAAMTIATGGGITMPLLPTSNPGGSGNLWNNSGVVNIT